ncbi:TPA: fimbrial protein [Raoultella ornithinolytica]|nr:fimbrial protein [Raoultella ornithinolytica]HAT1671182.1 fimbrial protein [Raoultella ornithinolytica]
MKLEVLAIAAVAASILSSTTAFADDPVPNPAVNGGEVHFKGEIVNAGCAIDNNSINQTVQLGQVRSVKLKDTGSMSTPVGFRIQLDDCDISIASKASFAFSGTAVEGHNDVLALQSSSAGGADKVGIQIVDKDGKAMLFDGATFSNKTALNNGTNIIPFQARYYSLGNATAGTANADATFKVQYE